MREEVRMRGARRTSCLRACRVVKTLCESSAAAAAAALVLVLAKPSRPNGTLAWWNRKTRQKTERANPRKL